MEAQKPPKNQMSQETKRDSEEFRPPLKAQEPKKLEKIRHLG